MRADGLGAHQQVLRGLPGQALLRRQRRSSTTSRSWPSSGSKALFGAEHANVQPHSGANANMCVYQALLEPGDTVLGLSLDHGGHLTHGSPVNASGMLYHFVAYKVTPGDERIDMDQVRDLALEHRPKMIVAGTTSYPRRIDPEPFRAIADEVGALFLFDAAHIAGLIAGGAAPEPGAVRRRRHVHDAQDAARPAWRLHPVARAEHAAAIDKAVFPGWQGGPLEHVIAAKAVAFREAADPASRTTPSRSSPTPRRWPRRWPAKGFRLVSRRHRQPPDGGRPAHRSTPSSPARRPSSRSTRPASR